MFFYAKTAKEIKKQYNKFEKSNEFSVLKEDRYGARREFFLNVDNIAKDLTQNPLYDGDYPTALDSIARDQYGNKFIELLQQASSAAYIDRQKLNEFKIIEKICSLRKQIEKQENVLSFLKEEGGAEETESVCSSTVSKIKELQNEYNDYRLLARAQSFGLGDEYKGIILKENNRLIVAFPGTRDLTTREGLKDLLTDATFVGDNGGDSSLSKIGVHGAFAKDVKSFSEEMIKAIKKIKGEDKVDEIWFTGHSKGGGEAILASYLFANYVKTKGDDALSVFHRKNRVKAFTFSAPTVVDERTKKIFHDEIGAPNIIRVHKKPDAVPAIAQIVGLVPLGYGFELPKPENLNYYKGYLCSHFLCNFDETDREHIFNLVQYENKQRTSEEETLPREEEISHSVVGISKGAEVEIQHRHGLFPRLTQKIKKVMPKASLKLKKMFSSIFLFNQTV